jgi:hypothetical protein
LAVTYLPKLQPSEHFGWAFGTWTDIYDHAVPGEDYWAVTRIVLTSTGGQLFVKPDDAAKSWFSTDFYPIVTTNWSHSSVEKIRFSQPWDAVCDFDYITIQASSPVNKLAAVQFRPVAAGRTYTPQFSTNLTLGGWSPLTGYSGPVTNLDQVTITDTNAVGPQKFYRIKISLP